VGFLVAASSGAADAAPAVDGLTPVAAVARVSGPAADAIRTAITGMWIAPDFETARAAASRDVGPIATAAGDVFRGAQVVEGGARAEARGILTTKREIKELAERAETEHAEVER